VIGWNNFSISLAKTHLPAFDDELFSQGRWPSRSLSRTRSQVGRCTAATAATSSPGFRKPGASAPDTGVIAEARRQPRTRAARRCSGRRSWTAERAEAMFFVL